MSSLKLETRGPVAFVTLDNPTRCNALDRPCIASFQSALDAARLPSSGARVLVLTGAGRVFCSGLDLMSLQPTESGVSEREPGATRSQFESLIERISELRMPVIAAVNGAAVGAGMSLAVACDIMIMAADAYLDPSFIRLGMVPDGGLTYHLPRRIGAARAALSLMTGRRIDAATAVQWGLAMAAVPGESLLGEATTIAAELASAPTTTLCLLRHALRDTFEHSLRQQVREEMLAQRDALASRDCREGIRAFFEKRPPKFNAIE